MSVPNSTANSDVEALIPNVMVLQGGAFGDN